MLGRSYAQWRPDTTLSARPQLSPATGGLTQSGQTETVDEGTTLHYNSNSSKLQNYSNLWISLCIIVFIVLVRFLKRLELFDINLNKYHYLFHFRVIGKTGPWFVRSSGLAIGVGVTCFDWKGWRILLLLSRFTWDRMKVLGSFDKYQCIFYLLKRFIQHQKLSM